MSNNVRTNGYGEIEIEVNDERTKFLNPQSASMAIAKYWSPANVHERGAQRLGQWVTNNYLTGLVDDDLFYETRHVCAQNRIVEQCVEEED